MTNFSAAPIVSVHRNIAVTSSRDVAAYFKKPHANVTRAIQALLREGGVLNFEETPFIDPQNNQRYFEYLMDRDAFTILAMSFTGKTALKFKLAYIAEFNRMAATLENRSVRDDFDLSDSAFVLKLLAAQATRALEETNRANAAEQRVELLAPRAAALDQLAASEGSQSITETAKSLNVPPKKLFSYLEAQGWIFRRECSNGELGPWMPRADKIQAGWLEKTYSPRLNRYGQPVFDPQTRVTAAGHARLAYLFKKNGYPE